MRVYQCLKEEEEEEERMSVMHKEAVNACWLAQNEILNYSKN